MSTVWLVTIPVVGLVRADTAEEAEAILETELDRLGFSAYGDGRRVTESEPVDPESEFTPHQCTQQEGS